MPSEQDPPRTLMAILRNAAFILGIVLLLISLIALPIDIRSSPFGIVFRFMGTESARAVVVRFSVYAPILFAISVAAIAMGSSMPKAPCAIAIGFIALGTTARSFVPTQMCGLTALITSSIGFALCGWELLRRRSGQPILFPLFGLAFNGGVVLLSVLLIVGLIERHLIDLLEHGHEFTLEALGLASTIGIFLLFGTFIWCWARAHPRPVQTAN